MASEGGWWWPTIADETGARKAIKGAWQASFVVAGLSTLIAVVAIARAAPVLGYDGYALADGVLMGVTGWRIMRNSRAWSIVGLVYWTFSLVVKIVNGRPGGAYVVAVIILLAFINGVRGTFALDKMKMQAQVPVGTP